MVFFCFFKSTKVTGLGFLNAQNSKLGGLNSWFFLHPFLLREFRSK